MSSSNRSTIAGAIGAPPEYTRVKDEKSRPSADSSLISAVNTVIAPTVNVQRCFSIRSSVAAGSNRNPSTSGMRVRTQTAMWPTSPVM